jgi:hypothetical protein
VDESRGQYRQQVIDITEQRGKVERDLLYAKQEAEKCYMAAIGRCVFPPHGGVRIPIFSQAFGKDVPDS